MHKITIYISSRSKTQSSGLDNNITLSDLRIKLREELEKETFLGEEIIEVIIHENNFAPDGSQDAHQISINKINECNIVVILYNGDSGWNPALNGNGICHDEYLYAVDKYSQMMYMLDVSSVFPRSDKKGLEQQKDLDFQANVEKNNFGREFISATSTEELHENALTQIKSYILDALEKSFKTQKFHVRKSTIFGETLHFAQLTYAERADRIKKKLEDSLPAMFPDIILNINAVPDNMSVADARANVGRPFLVELSFIQGKNKNKGVIHIIGVYGTVTELQVKNLVGFPDLAVNKTSFGFYLWDTTNHIQMFFLQKCINTETVGSNINYLEQWLKTSGERERITKRAEARYSILQAINNSKQFITK